MASIRNNDPKLPMKYSSAQMHSTHAEVLTSAFPALKGCDLSVRVHLFFGSSFLPSADRAKRKSVKLQTINVQMLEQLLIRTEANEVFRQQAHLSAAAEVGQG